MNDFKKSAALFTVSLFLSISLAAQVNNKPNILFIAVDDLNNNVSTFGYKKIPTPNLDRIAKIGVKFPYAYCQYPVCNPSRSSVLTGYMPDKTKIYDLESHFRDNLPNVVTLPQLFRENGYYTSRIGKIYHMGYDPKRAGTNFLDDPLSWNRMSNPVGKEVEDDSLMVDMLPNHIRDFHYLEAEGTDEQQRDGIIALEGVAQLKEFSKSKNNQPFFLALGFNRPHVPLTAPKKYFDKIPLQTIEMPPFDPKDLEDIPKPALSTVPPYWGIEEPNRTIITRAYYATTIFMDAQLGKILDELDRLKLADNTIIVLWSDNGYNLGEHAQWAKNSLFEESAKVPLIIAAPGFASNKESPRMVELLDIYPTLADLCNIKLPQELDGVSLKPLLANPVLKWDRPAYSQVNRRGADNIVGRSIRTEHYRYTEWSNGDKGVELYDHVKDPQEIKNLAKLPEYKERIKVLSEQLREKADINKN